MKITIKSKIILGFALLAAFSLMMGVYGLSRLSLVSEFAARTSENDVGLMHLVGDLAASRKEMSLLRQRALAEFLLWKSGEAEKAHPLTLEQWRRAKEQTAGLLRELASTCSEFMRQAVSPERKAQLERILQQSRQAEGPFNETVGQAELYFSLMSRGETKPLLARSESLSRLQEAFDSKADSIQELIRENVPLGKAATEAVYRQARLTTLLVLAVILILAGALSLLIQRSITLPLASFMQFVERVGQGDLTRQIVVSTNGDELGRMGQNLNGMVAGLKELALQARAATENLSSSASEILASTTQQAASAGEQAASVQETTSTMDEVRQSGLQISERAKQLIAATEAAGQASRSGLDMVQRTTQSMDAIREQAESVAENIVALSEKTQAVGNIIATVNEIAERSHLVSLNAAIEASSAGEEGRRFSVVAGEIKSLADQAKEATLQVRAILGEIQKGINSAVMLTEEAVKRVEAGRQQAEATDRSIRQMAATSQESVQAFQQIAAASNQQQIGFEQVSRAMQNIRQATEQTASGTRQLEKSAASLSALAQQLTKVVERYRV